MAAKPPTRSQQNHLRRLAQRTGETFTPPSTSAEASAEIRRMERRGRSARADIAADRRTIAAGFDAAGGATAVRDDELHGYGSSARWANATDRR
jgi:hypothetical protein